MTCTTAADALGCTVTALRSGLAYRVAVTAANALGSGPESTAIVATPGGPPGVPDGLVLVLTDGLLSASWTAPADTGGAALTGFTVTAVPLPTPPPTSPAPAGGTTSAGGAVPLACAVPPTTTACRLGPLHPGTSYQVSVTATNQFGTGATAPQIISTGPAAPAPGPPSAPAAADPPTASTSPSTTGPTTTGPTTTGPSTPSIEPPVSQTPSATVPTALSTGP